MPLIPWDSLKTTEFAGLDPARTLVLMPVAAVEQHGPHLPLGTDARINAGLVDRLARRLPSDLTLLALPAQTVGASAEHIHFPGTLSLEPETLLAVWVALGAAVRRAGLDKLLILNSHGGQGGLAELAARRLRLEHGLLAVVANSYGLGPPEGLFPARETRFGHHGGTIETSMMLALHPDLVDRSALRDFASREEALAAEAHELRAVGPAAFAWTAEDLNPAGATGDAAAADALRGDQTLDAMAARLATLVQEMAGFALPARPLAPRSPETPIGDSAPGVRAAHRDRK